MAELETIVVANIFAFMLVFTRVGLAVMIMPGVGDSFVPEQIRLLFALAFSFVLAPVLAPVLPPIPATAGGFASLLVMEAIIGAFIGTVARILMTSLDTAGMMLSLQSGIANAQIFNPATGGQGSLAGALFSTLGVVLIMATGLHHMMLRSVLESYALFYAGSIPDWGNMADVITRMVSAAFMLGFQLAIPFVLVGLVVYVGFGLLGRLMPQIQVFFLALPLQILLSLVTLFLTISTIALYWLGAFESLFVDFLT